MENSHQAQPVRNRVERLMTIFDDAGMYDENDIAPAYGLGFEPFLTIAGNDNLVCIERGRDLDCPLMRMFRH